MPPRNIVTPTKASESVVSRILAKALGVATSETIAEVCVDYCQEADVNEPLTALVKRVQGLYPWMADVASDVMCPSTTPLAEHMLSLPGVVFVAKDNLRSGADSLWLLVADPTPGMLRAIQEMPCRGLFHTFKIGGEHSMLVALQLSSCRQ